MANYGTYGSPTPAVRTVRKAKTVPAQALQGRISGRSEWTNPYDAGLAATTLGTDASGRQSQLGYGRITTPELPYVPAAPAGTPSTYSAPSISAQALPSSDDYEQYDLSTDPILQQMRALASSQRAGAEASALAQRKKLAIQYGDVAYGKGIDEATGQAAEQNPFSVFANLRTQYTRGNQNLEEALNAHNLYYGGARIKALADALQDYQGQQAYATGQEQEGLENVNQNRIAALMAADQMEQSAYADAYNRGLQWQLAHPRIAATPQGPGPAAPAPVSENSYYTPFRQPVPLPRGWYVQ